MQNHNLSVLDEKELGKINSKKLDDLIYSLTIYGARKYGKKGDEGPATQKDIYS
ncbi:hypothetical protein ACS7OT_02495 [Bacillus safensis]